MSRAFFKAASLSLLFGATLALTSGLARAQQCSEKLLAPNKYINTSDIRSLNYLRDAMCSKSFEEFKDDYGAQTGASYMEILSGKGNFNYNTYEKKKSELARSLLSPSSVNHLVKNGKDKRRDDSNGQQTSEDQK